MKDRTIQFPDFPGYGDADAPSDGRDDDQGRRGDPFDGGPFDGAPGPGCPDPRAGDAAPFGDDDGDDNGDDPAPALGLDGRPLVRMVAVRTPRGDAVGGDEADKEEDEEDEGDDDVDADFEALYAARIAAQKAVQDAAPADPDQLRLGLAAEAGCRALAVDSAGAVRAGDALETMMAHQLAAAHVMAMRFAGRAMALSAEPDKPRWRRFADDGPHDFDAARAAASAAHMMSAYRATLVTLDRLRHGHRLTITVERPDG